MLSKSEQNDTQKPSNTDPEESKAERDASKDDLLHNSINTGTYPVEFIYFMRFSFTIISISNNNLIFG
mgnify:FL=1